MAKDATFVKDPAGWKAAFGSWEGTLGVHLRKKTEELANAARIEAPKSKNVSHFMSRSAPHAPGTLAASIRVAYSKTLDGDLESEVRANTKYAAYVHEGTGPHTIRSKIPGKKLNFFWPSHAKVVYDTEVRHPGTKPNRFLHRAMTQVF